MRTLFLGFIYFMFFLSGAAALVYQVVWVRSLTLIFGGSHLAVTVVLSIFMAGLAVGGYFFGKYVDRIQKPLRLYGFLELGIALFALVFMGLMKLYPSIYVALAQGKDQFPIYLTFLRTLFSVIALIIPTTLMGGTLPSLSQFVSRQPENLRGYLSFLYGFNTFGAVFGAIAAGFFFLRFYSVSTTTYIAILTNVFIGLASILIQDKAAIALSFKETKIEQEKGLTPEKSTHPLGWSFGKNIISLKLVLWGIGVSGFCALGYEVLWSRILTIVVGASVYSFTTMLVAFLTGIALGSEVYGFLPKFFRVKETRPERSISWFGIVQIAIGVTALLVTLFIRDIPFNSLRLQNFLIGGGIRSFGLRTWLNFLLAFIYMVVPAFFMGVAFPLAGKVYAEYKKKVGSAVGEVLAYNTVGAILGATISGFIMIYFFGIERSLQMLAIINIGFGLLVLFSLRNIKLLYIGVSSLTIGLLLFLGFNQSTFRIWDMKYFAIFRSNQPEAFRTPEMVREAIENTDVLYYGEGIETIVSTIKIKGGEQSFITNGRIEASSHLQGKQHLFALGHLPMLLHKNPKRILVVGLGAGITLGATSIHPSVEELTLVELEPKVIGVAKTFEKYNHSVLNNPKLKVVFNDGRNYLTTTKNKFDVITADPIHPWFRGAGYLYTTQYFKLASEHLNPGGILCQWLPIYEMTPDDLRSVVRTFHEHFKYTMLWLTLSDAEIIGSNTPIVIDESELERRIAESPILSDLKQVMMGSATDFLSYFVMGTEAMRNFSDGGVINTDDNLYLEFSAPFSIATRSVMEDNVYVLLKHSESILPYLTPEKSVKERISQEKKWASIYEAGKFGGPALALFLGGKTGTQEFNTYLRELDKKFPEYAPGRFLKSEYQTLLAMNPRLLQKLPLTFLNQEGRKIIIEISAVLVPVSKQRASIMFVDNQARVVYGQLYVWNYDKDEFVNRFVSEVLMGIQTTYQKEVESWMSRKGEVPLAEPTLRKIKDIIILIAKKYSPQEGNS